MKRRARPGRVRIAGASVALLRDIRARIRAGEADRLGEMLARDRFGGIRFPIRSRIIDYYFDNACLHPRLFESNRPYRIKPPANFSFIDAPEQTMEFLEDFVLLAKSSVRGITVDQEHVKNIDFCAGLLLNVLAKEVGRKLRVSFSGVEPRDPRAREISVATGLAKALGVRMPAIEIIEPYGVWVSKNQELTPFTSSTEERAADAFITRVAGSYKKRGHVIDDQGKKKLGNLVGEVLDNAEQHFGKGWWLSGYVREPHGLEYGDCHIAIFNFGPTLSETLQMLPTESLLRDNIEEIVGIHEAHGYFAKLKHRWTPEDLWTVLALQEGVTRRYGVEDRGFGTIDMITAFEALGKSVEQGIEPRMCIVSGRTHILFDGHPTLRDDPSAPPGQERKIVPFNDEGDLKLPPRDGAVRHLDRYFPGTMISLRFYIDERYLRAKMGGI